MFSMYCGRVTTPLTDLFCFYLFCQTFIKQILISDKDNLSKYKNPFLNDGFIH